MIVADNNLTIQLILKNAQTELAQAIYRQDSHWIMPARVGCISFANAPNTIQPLDYWVGV